VNLEQREEPQKGGTTPIGDKRKKRGKKTFGSTTKKIHSGDFNHQLQRGRETDQDGKSLMESKKKDCILPEVIVPRSGDETEPIGETNEVAVNAFRQKGALRR